MDVKQMIAIMFCCLTVCITVTICTLAHNDTEQRKNVLHNRGHEYVGIYNGDE